ncbi:class I SAM-dependent methyltransferase [Variovorax sp. ZT5P49]|uniref:class I SAM-dependent methyltransferase n=1 Tax=Variovorax sp. ZT5P49 TaxID=3443733 RepID=UPI003F47377C
MKTAIHSLEAFAQLQEEIDRLPDEMSRIDRLCDVYLSADGVPPAMLQSDPFGEQHLEACRKFLASLSGGTGYDAAKNERSDFLDGFTEGHYTPSIYRYNDSRMVGDSLSAAGAIITAMDVRAGDAVLEYGAGDGQISLALARMGCDVSVIDIDERYLRIIDRQAAAMGIKVNTVKGLFGDGVPGKKFDRVLFYEAFHHSLDHAATLLRLRDVLKPGGRLLLAGEPIIAKDNYWRNIVPFAWGPRLDGLSLRAIRAYGWCELGFQREYLIEKMMRTGWLVQFRKCPATDRGDVYTCTRAPELINIGDPLILVESTRDDDGWHDGEGATRWTRGRASIGLDQTQGAFAIELKLHNFLPLTRPVTVTAGDFSDAFELAPGEAREVTLPMQRSAAVLTIDCEPMALSQAIPGHHEDRVVGVSVSTLRYRSRSSTGE